MEEQNFIAITNRFSWACLAYNQPISLTIMNVLILLTAVDYLEKFEIIDRLSTVIAILGGITAVRLTGRLRRKVRARPERYKIVPSWLPAEWERTLVANHMTPSTKAQYWFASQNIAQLGSMPEAERSAAFARLAMQYKTTHPRA